MNTTVRRVPTVLVWSIMCCATSLASAITISTVPVGNLGNANDPATGSRYGGVSYAYNIGTTEVTVGQYTAFLNAVAATDTYELYNTSMASDLNIAGIARDGSSGSYSYSVIGSANHPVTYVSWGDAARFSNWLNNGQPVGAQNASTTEDGAYTLNGAVDNASLNAVSRNSGAAWFLPSENEWYKAAYYQPAGDADDYWNYPTRTNSDPYSVQPPGSGAPTQSNTGNFYLDGIASGYNDGYAVTGSSFNNASQNYLTDVGAYTSASSPYGTFDQGGNAYEWNETLIDGLIRGLRGGSWRVGELNFSALGRSGDFPVTETNGFGFRVATVPEPASLLLAMLGLVALVACRNCHRVSRKVSRHPAAQHTRSSKRAAPLAVANCMQSKSASNTSGR